MGNLIIGMGNTGTQIVKAAAESKILNDTEMFVIDSVTSNVDMDSVTRIKSIPIVSDEKCGSGRSRERGRAMFEHHDALGDLEPLYEAAKKALSPVVIITSSAGGTGSGSTPALCEKLIANGVIPIPIIVCPSLQDPQAWHLNTNDLMLELEEVGKQTPNGAFTYTIFRNEYGKVNYTEINNDVVTLIEIIFGKRYEATKTDDIDASDLDTILSVPGRFIATTAAADTPEQLARIVTQKVLTGHQPAWTTEEAERTTMMKAYALTSPFATDDFETVFANINERIPHSFDEYRNVNNKDGRCYATIIIAGLPRVELQNVDAEFMGANSIGDGVHKSSRPAFLQKKGTVRTSSSTGKDKPAIFKQFDVKSVK